MGEHSSSAASTRSCRPRRLALVPPGSPPAPRTRAAARGRPRRPCAAPWPVFSTQDRHCWGYTASQGAVQGPQGAGAGLQHVPPQGEGPGWAGVGEGRRKSPAGEAAWGFVRAAAASANPTRAHRLLLPCCPLQQGYEIQLADVADMDDVSGGRTRTGVRTNGSCGGRWRQPAAAA
jgi:hypothetical protein